MNRMLPLMMTAVVMLSFSYAYVYAERSVVEVPFDFTGTGCTFDQEAVVYTCKWQGSNETLESTAIQEAGIIPPEQIAEESKEAHEEAVTQEEEEALTPTERKVAELEKEVISGEISSGDAVLLKALKDMDAVCQLGIEHGERIQQFAEFEIPVITPDTLYKAIDLDSHTALGKILKKKMECEMWDDYRVSHLGQRYLDIVVDDSTTQGHHRDTAKDMIIYPSQVITDADLQTTLTTAKDFICTSNYFDNVFKKQSDCFEKPVLVAGGISMADNPAMKKYQQWKGTGSQNMADLKKAEVERMTQESLESFAQQHGIDIQSLKALVHNDDIAEYNENKIKGGKP